MTIYESNSIISQFQEEVLAKDIPERQLHLPTSKTCNLIKIRGTLQSRWQKFAAMGMFAVYSTSTL